MRENSALKKWCKNMREATNKNADQAEWKNNVFYRLPSGISKLS